MNIYLFMGTHLPEIRTCLETLAANCPDRATLQVHVPTGLGRTETGEKGATIHFYDTEAAHWVFDPDAEGNAFILLDPRIPQIPQLEKIAGDLRKCLIEPVKVVTCVDCEAAESSPQLRAWLEADIYYSDIVLLGNRLNASKSFVRDFQKTYEKNCYPCLFLFLKGKGVPSQPLEILTPDTRRLSQLFDLPENTPDEIPGLVIESSCDLDVDDPESDPYRAPDPEEGQARMTIPAISGHIVF